MFSRIHEWRIRANSVVPPARFGAMLLLLVPGVGAAAGMIGNVSVEVRAFPHDAAFPGQHEQNISIAASPEIYQDWNRGSRIITISPFARFDWGDEDRTHWDLREAYLLEARGNWEASIGMRRVFWGVAESRHLVDIINQTDLIENPDGEDKLGQPMITISTFQDWGVVDLYLMSGFRERTYPGLEGRLRLPIGVGDPVYESEAEEWRFEWAVRWARTFGVWDVGLSHFSGTGREPRLLPDVSGGPPPRRLNPHYDLVEQTGIDVQATVGGWLWKFEAIRHAGYGSPYGALVSGFEYTIVGLFDADTDLGVLVEYLRDERDASPSLLQNDLFAGLRFVLNDVQGTEILAGVIQDLDTSSALVNIEASRRFGERWRLYLEYRGFQSSDNGDPLASLDSDDYLQLELARFF